MHARPHSSDGVVRGDKMIFQPRAPSSFSLRAEIYLQNRKWNVSDEPISLTNGTLVSSTILAELAGANEVHSIC